MVIGEGGKGKERKGRAEGDGKGKGKEGEREGKVTEGEGDGTRFCPIPCSSKGTDNLTITLMDDAVTMVMTSYSCHSTSFTSVAVRNTYDRYCPLPVYA